MAHATPGEKRPVSIDVGEFVRTRDALSTAYMSLSTSIDHAVKAYIAHTNVVLAGDAALDVSYLTQPFNTITSAQIAQLALSHGTNGAIAFPAATAGTEDTDGKKKKKRAYKARDPNAPKRPLTAYFRFLQEQRPGLTIEMAKARDGAASKPGDLSKEATERWHKMTKEDQEPYKEAYRDALKDYEKEVDAYKASTGLPVEDAASPVDEETLIPGITAAAAEAEDEETSSDDSSSDDDVDEEEEDAKLVMPPPPPPKAVSPVKKTPKSALKKTEKATPVAASPAPQTPRFSSINPSGAVQSVAKSSSPEIERKRKATSDAVADGAEEGTKKKRGRKTNAAKAEEAAAAAAVAAAPAAVLPSSDGSGELKKEKKKKRKSVAAGSDA
ncbi:hypothetical protein LTR95_010325 [Oleoguttula sp. CCFEE 5521]